MGEIAFFKTGSKPTKIYDYFRNYKYINAGTTYSGFTDDFNCEGDTVTTPSRGQGGIGFVAYQDKPFWLGPLCYKIQSNTKAVMNKYIYYCLSNDTEQILLYKNSGGVPSLNSTDVAKIKIPIPSLKEQERIVLILDRFDKLCNDISEGLPAEINARQKQYEYYRDKLLTFKELI